ncbi:MAG: hypothetical protein KKE02_18390 [Alphaproteobacteria bacterium]|nr:hypothetical protein [Alphaproteobacteria bacterium]MBU1515271.1 hypothetical protein [Alphaproteobacteria bacterium]MBU2092401.1 hypothetical protein [Alphaproteobacteria bacterium]MBU2152995.1 hypothetical protein [Alphaproteobacteria bacterium]MBU2305826.1 hypothetical protein [Alphaproteobacteria bacterium]
MTVDRRRWLAGAGAAALAPALIPNMAKAAGATRMYDYLFLDLEAPAGTPPSKAYADQVRARAAGIAAAGGEVLGLFTPQLGWHARQAALLVGWKPDAPGREEEIDALQKLGAVGKVERHRLAATARPAATDRPKPGGIYVHRWFVIGAEDQAEVVALSVEGWRDFEARFDTNIFGLFAAERSAADKAAGVTRLLLTTRYKDHGVWETSRDPSTAAMAAFARRQKLTRDTWAASTLLTVL